MDPRQACDTEASAAAPRRRECRICWHVYDPGVGDPVWQIPAGTAFADLPPHWTCPNCSATQDQFLDLSDAT
ncbi:MAG: rubredoxin [Burkholderiales bacterium]|nr:rubredoxin [Burkholderiales bacterium]